MQLYLYIFFSDNIEELCKIIVTYFEKNNIIYRVEKDNNFIAIVTPLFVTWIYVEKSQFTYKWIKEDHNVDVNQSISFQLYPECSEQRFGKLIKYLLSELRGDLYLSSEWDDEGILYRNDLLCIIKNCWKDYLD